MAKFEIDFCISISSQQGVFLIVTRSWSAFIKSMNRAFSPSASLKFTGPGTVFYICPYAQEYSSLYHKGPNLGPLSWPETALLVEPSLTTSVTWPSSQNCTRLLTNLFVWWVWSGLARKHKSATPSSVSSLHSRAVQFVIQQPRKDLSNLTFVYSCKQWFSFENCYSEIHQ